MLIQLQIWRFCGNRAKINCLETLMEVLGEFLRRGRISTETKLFVAENSRVGPPC